MREESGFNDLLHNITFMSRQVVDDDDVAALERRPQALFKISEEGGSPALPCRAFFMMAGWRRRDLVARGSLRVLSYWFYFTYRAIF